MFLVDAHLIQYWRYLFFINLFEINIFFVLKLEIALLAIPASSE